MSGRGQTLPNAEDKLHPAVVDVLSYFEYDHLPEGSAARTVSSVFHDLAWNVAMRSPQRPQLTVSLQLLLQSKDAAVRANLPAA